MVMVSGPAAKALEDAGQSDVLGDLRADERRKAEAKHPKPTAASITSLKAYLDPRFKEFWSGKQLGDDEEGSGWDSLQSIRDMRYGRDTTPEEIRKKLKYTKRVRSRLTNNEIRRVASLLGRNPIRARVPSAGTSAENARRAQAQTAFINGLPLILDQQAPFPINQRLDDATTEAGLVGVEIYLTGAYDDIDWQRGDLDDTDEATGDKQKRTETDAEYKLRLTEQRRTRKLPFGIRYVDPAALRFEMGEDGIEKVEIVERKSWRHIVDKYGAVISKGADDMGIIDPDVAPRPDDWGSGSDDVRDGASGSARDVECIRYYDEYWYAYTANGIMVECEPHGMPFVPVGLGMSRLTSSSDYSEMFQGVVHGLVNLEQALNDWATVEQDKRLTYGRPKPVATTTNMAAVALNEGQPFNVDLSDDSLVILPPGYAIDNAYKDFTSTDNDGFGQFLLSLFQMNGMSPSSQGFSPGSDPSGYLVNSLQNAGNAPYEGQFDNKARLWRWILDCCRKLIRDVICEPVEIADLLAKDGSDAWLTLGPDDIDDTPCKVEIDPMDDTNRMAITQWLMGGYEAGLVPPELVQERAYGAEDPKQWNAAIARAELRKRLRLRAVDEALARVDEAEAARQKAERPTILGPNGQPLAPSDATQGPQTPQMPPPPGPPAPAVGADQMAAQDGANPAVAGFTAGQRPTQQGLAGGEASGMGM